MSELRAEPLSPFDAATLWAQLHRLNTEVIATRSADHLFVSAGLAATRLTHLPRMPKTAVFGVKRGLGYRGVAVIRELAGGSGWEVVSLRLARDIDDETVIALLSAACRETAHRMSRTVYLRIAEGSPHIAAVKRAGMMAYTLERLFAPSADVVAPLETSFRAARRQDRHAIFRLYCRAVPEHVRRQEAVTQQEWRSVLDSYECDSEFVFERDGVLHGWAGAGSREARLLIDDSDPSLVPAALDLIETKIGRHGIVVLAEHQLAEQRLASERGYTALGTRLTCARRVAMRNPLKEAIAVPAVDTIPLAQ